jgi:hypothetical protein
LVQVSKSSILPNLGHCDIDGWVFVLFWVFLLKKMGFIRFSF